MTSAADRARNLFQVLDVWVVITFWILFTDLIDGRTLNSKWGGTIWPELPFEWGFQSRVDFFKLGPYHKFELLFGLLKIGIPWRGPSLKHQFVSSIRTINYVLGIFCPRLPKYLEFEYRRKRSHCLFNNDKYLTYKFVKIYVKGKKRITYFQMQRLVIWVEAYFFYQDLVKLIFVQLNREKQEI